MPNDAPSLTTRPERAPRRRVLKAGLICFNGRHSTLPCQVRDISSGGVKLNVQGSVGVPDTFELYIELDGTWVDCEVTWRRGEMVGARFTSEVKTEPPKRRQTLMVTSESRRPSLRRPGR